MKFIKKLAVLLSAVMLISVLPAAAGSASAADKKFKLLNVASNTVTVYAGSAYQIKTNAKKVTYKSSRKYFAGVTKDGVVRTKRKGNATITVTNSATGESIKLKLKVKNPVGYKVSTNSGKYTYTQRVKIKAKKGYTVYYTTSGKFKTNKKLKSKKSVILTMKKDTTLRLYVEKNGKKVTVKQMNKARGKKINCPMYKYTFDMPSTPFNPNNVTFTLKNGVYTNESGSLTVTWKNGSKEEILHGESYTVEKYENGKWTKLEYAIENLVFVDSAYILKPSVVFDKTYDIKSLYGELSAGKYRIKDSYLVNSESVGNPNGSRTIKYHYVYAEFTV